MCKFFVVIFFLFPLFVFSQSELVISKSEVKFEIKNAGFTVNGTLGSVNGLLRFDPKNIKGSKIKVWVQVKDLNTGIESRDKHLKKKEYFNLGDYPEIIMESKFFGSGENSFKGYFTLTMKGVSKDVTIPFTYKENGGKGEMIGEFVLNRVDFGVGEKSFVMADKVKIIINLKFEVK